ncbi:hypothetical protein [Deinococcus cellulosilyticus]|uniref:Uncharacterized protein n=1 Tax=Deinococcus cellulosilyticus (strain DSM 18568 / NBRC 106333 / KACC 11606 / 5516J-15) TaxID=1223518 RepID=A0A511N1B7_DEIC1|nr:hypothetical protein [Deinococcus cellulosilyticus]GEM46248.1 hypothetical protein DC3_18830 [Deinococcus cellulosilyticus NBRC 106333 = KACC 11606]
MTPQDWLTIQDEAAAAFLVSPEGTRFFQPFLAQECTIKELTQLLGCTTLQAYRAVENMEKLGLIRLVGRIPRRGKPLKVYRSVADHVFVPFKYAPHHSFEDLMVSRDNTWRDQLFQGLAHQIYQAEREDGRDLGLRFMRHEGVVYVVQALGSGQDGSPGLMSRFRGQDAPAVRDDWRLLSLTRAQAKALQQDMQELLEKYSHQDRGEGANYVLRMALAPHRES